MQGAHQGLDRAEGAMHPAFADVLDPFGETLLEDSTYDSCELAAASE